MPRRKPATLVANVAEPAITKPATLVPPLGPNEPLPDQTDAQADAEVVPPEIAALGLGAVAQHPPEEPKPEPPSPFAERLEKAKERAQGLLDRIAAHHIHVQYETPNDQLGAIDQARKWLLIALTHEHHLCSACGHDDGPRLHPDEAVAREYEIQAALMDREFQEIMTGRDLASLGARRQQQQQQQEQQITITTPRTPGGQPEMRRVVPASPIPLNRAARRRKTHSKTKSRAPQPALIHRRRAG